MSTHDDDTDPTGMRALLRGLPDPGPMPDDLVARIQASLTDLAVTTGRDEDDGGRAMPAPGDVFRGTGVPRRRSWLARHGSKLAVAAVVLVGGGAAMELLGSGLGVGGTSADSVAGSTDGGAESRSGSPGSAPREADGDSAAERAAEEATEGPVVVTMSGRSYTTADLADQVGASSTESPVAPFTAESPGIGPIGTEIGVRSCLQALGLPRETAARVDLGLVDGSPAAVVVVTAGGERTAYAVRRECTLGDPAVLVGPVPLS